MSCEPEKVTALVDGALDAAERERVEAHLASCGDCRAQAGFERDLRRRLAALPSPPLPDTVEARVRRGLRAGRSRPVLRRLAPIAAVLTLVALWSYATPSMIATQLAWDHLHCFDKPRLPAKVWTADSVRMEEWLDERMAHVPDLPDSAAGLDLLGGRQCPVILRRVGHVYYASGDHRLSVYLVPGWVRMGRSIQFTRGGRTVRLLRSGGAVVGLVSERREAVDAFERALTTAYARGF